MLKCFVNFISTKLRSAVCEQTLCTVCTSTTVLESPKGVALLFVVSLDVVLEERRFVHWQSKSKQTRVCCLRNERGI